MGATERLFTDAPLQPPAATNCSRDAEFVPLGSIPDNYHNVWQAIGARSSYLVWSHVWSGNDIRVQSFHWSAESGITAIDVLDDEVGHAPGGAAPVDVDLYITQVSADGSAVLGSRSEDDVFVGGFRWTLAGRQQRLDFDPSASSRDGSVVVGFRAAELVRWTEATGTQPLGGVTTPVAAGMLRVSAGGEVIAGVDARGHLFHWTEATGSTDLGELSPGRTYTRLQFIDDRGDVLAGLADDHTIGRAHLFRWTPVGGLQDLEELTGATGGSLHVSADTRVAVADVRMEDSGLTHVLRWTALDGGGTGLQDLTPGPESANVSFVSPDADVVIGSVKQPIALGFRWSAATGVESLLLSAIPSASVGARGNLVIGDPRTGPPLLTFGDPAARGPLFDLIPPGFVPAGWSEPRLEGISDDGGLLVGSALNPEGQRESWLLRARGCEP